MSFCSVYVLVSVMIYVYDEYFWLPTRALGGWECAPFLNLSWRKGWSHDVTLAHGLWAEILGGASQFALSQGSSHLSCIFCPLHSWNTVWCRRWSSCLVTAQPQGGWWIVEWRDRRSLALRGPGLPLLDVLQWEDKKPLLDSATVSGFFFYSQGNVVLANMTVNFRTRWHFG